MKLIPLLDRLAATSASSAPAPRRALLAHLGRTMAAALPLGLGAAAAMAAPTTTYDALLQLLLLERLQAALYARGLAVAGLIPAAQTADFQLLRAHQDQHVQFLSTALLTAGAIVPPAPTFDFSGQHGVSSNPVLFPNVFSNYDSFLALAQQLEDLAVRLYKTHASDLTTDRLLAAALWRLQATEARHAAHLRGLRRTRGAVVLPWPSTDDAAIARSGDAQRLTTAATGGEDLAAQGLSAGVSVPFSDLLLIRDNTAVHDPSLPETFDEPVSATTAQAALDLFV